ncbi:hypothetical protein CEXT_319601 [Caerostris extrusa]|uniref:Uncharacterized protein n=1 Tax=Caerostris extrusa TaxID=172846 RepID=A0AAV4WU20_CAEEX|nr:hypothetical protein CEXT_319601 [Caerostris extrusa]
MFEIPRVFANEFKVEKFFAPEPFQHTIPWSQHDANRKRQCLSRGAPPTKQEMGTRAKMPFTDPITFRTRKEMEGNICLHPFFPLPQNRIHSFGGCLIFPFDLNLFFSPLLFFIALFERERQDLSFRIEIGLKGPQAAKVPLLSEGF